jgi:hypothetical protein
MWPLFFLCGLSVIDERDRAAIADAFQKSGNADPSADRVASSCFEGINDPNAQLK